MATNQSENTPEAWPSITQQLNTLTLTQAQADRDIQLLKESIKEVQSLSLRIQEQNFKIDKLLDLLDARKKESDVLFSKTKKLEQKIIECPLYRQENASRFHNLESEIVRIGDQWSKKFEDQCTALEEVFEEKIKAVNSGQVLFRWMLSIFLLISLSITAYNINKTLQLQRQIQKSQIAIEKMQERQHYINDAITQNANRVRDLERKIK